MHLLENFRERDFADQMNILICAGKAKDKECLPKLFLLYDTLTGDKAVDAMVEHTLRDILPAHEQETIERITSGTAKEKKLCLQVAAQKQFPSAAPALFDLVKDESDIGVLAEAFITMSVIRAPGFLRIFRKFLSHPDDTISGISIEMIASYKDLSAVSRLEQIVNEAETDGNYETCTVRTAKAVETLAVLGDDHCTRFLVSKVHHRNPTARRIVQEQLIGMGENPLPFFEDIFAGDNADKKIMAANTISRISTKKGEEILISALDKGQANTDNVRAAIYEAIGQINSLKSLVCLTGALNENNLQILIAAVSALDRRLNPEIIRIIK
jgi:HEAT repeat protein